MDLKKLLKKKLPKIEDMADVCALLARVTSVLFWSPFIPMLFGWYNLSTYLFVAFFISVGLTMITGVLAFINDRDHFSKTARFFQWLFLVGGVFMITVGLGILEFEPIIVILFSLPLARMLLSRSLTDILNDQAGAKHPWLDHTSDGLFLLSTISFVSLFFVDPKELLIGFMLMSLGLSLTLDQIHQGINKRDWASPSGLIAIALTVFFLPGVIIFFDGFGIIHW